MPIPEARLQRQKSLLENFIETAFDQVPDDFSVVE